VLQANQYGPAIGGQYPLGAYLEDHEYVAGSGDLDVHNGRTCVTPEYPGGTYAYFVTLNEQYQPAFPYVLGPTYYGTVQPGNTGPQSGHNTLPGGAVLYTPGSTGLPESPLPNLVLFPVPSNGILHIRNEDEAIHGVEVIDAHGRLVMQQRTTASTLTMDLGQLVSGQYTVRITSADGAVVTRPIVRQ
jgi:hypothetical protein